MPDIPRSLRKMKMKRALVFRARARKTAKHGRVHNAQFHELPMSLTRTAGTIERILSDGFL